MSTNKKMSIKEARTVVKGLRDLLRRIYSVERSAGEEFVKRFVDYGVDVNKTICYNRIHTNIHVLEAFLQGVFVDDALTSNLREYETTLNEDGSCNDLSLVDLSFKDVRKSAQTFLNSRMDTYTNETLYSIAVMSDTADQFANTLEALQKAGSETWSSAVKNAFQCMGVELAPDMKDEELLTRLLSTLPYWEDIHGKGTASVQDVKHLSKELQKHSQNFEMAVAEHGQVFDVAVVEYGRKALRAHCAREMTQACLCNITRQLHGFHTAFPYDFMDGEIETFKPGKVFQQANEKCEALHLNELKKNGEARHSLKRKRIQFEIIP